MSNSWRVRILGFAAALQVLRRAEAYLKLADVSAEIIRESINGIREPTPLIVQAGGQTLDQPKRVAEVHH